MERTELEPRLVHLICGLRSHQVEEAMRLLLDYVDGKSQSPDAAALIAMAEKWKQQARSRFLSAMNYSRGSMERRSIEMSAMCIANCAWELSEAVQGGLCPPPSATPEGV